MQETANDSRDFSKQNQVGILGVHSAYAALDLFVSVFLVARLLSVTDGDFSRVALFYACCWGGILLTFWLFSYVVKKFSRVWCIRGSAIGLLVGVILVLLLENNLREWYLLLGAVWGVASGIYWCSMHTFTSEALGGKKMSGYAAWYFITNAFMRIVFPFTLGAIIESPKLGFVAAAAIATGLAVVLVLFTLILRDRRKSEGKRFSVRTFLRLIRERKLSRPIWSQFWIQFLYGLQSVMTLGITILVFLSLQSNFSLGALTSIFAGVSIVALAIYKPIKSQRVKIWIYYVTSILPILAAIGLLFGASPLTVILCQAGYFSFRVVSNTELERARMNLMADFGAEHLHTEGLLFTEVSYVLARFVGLGLILAIYFSGVLYLFQVLLVLLATTVLLAAVLLHLWTRRHMSSTTPSPSVPPLRSKGEYQGGVSPPQFRVE